MSVPRVPRMTRAIKVMRSVLRPDSGRRFAASGITDN